MKSGAAIIPFVIIVVVVSLFAGSLLLNNGDDDNNSSDTYDQVSDYSKTSVVRETSEKETVSTTRTESFVVILDGNTGTTVKGSGTYDVGSKVTVSATCDDDTTFIAWLDEKGNVVSEKQTYSFTTSSTKTVRLFASCVTSIEWDANGIELYSEDDWTYAVWTIFQDSDEIGVSRDGTFVFDETGKYTVVISAVDSNGNEIDIVSEIIVRESTFGLTWEYDGDTYSVEVNVSYSDYYAASNENVTRSYLINDSNALAFVTPEDACIADIAEQLTAQLEEYGVTDKEDIANIVLDLVQMSIVYADDSELYGQDEYWAFPIEALYNKSGDCEDTTFLYASIMKAMGYDTVVCYVQYGMMGGHAFAMIELETCDGNSYAIAKNNRSTGIEYYYCETTPDENFECWDIGCEMANYDFISESHCFMTNDDDGAPTDYSIVRTHRLAP